MTTDTFTSEKTLLYGFADGHRVEVAKATNRSGEHILMRVGTGVVGFPPAELALVLDRIASAVRDGKPGEIAVLKSGNGYVTWEPSDPKPYRLTDEAGRALWHEQRPQPEEPAASAPATFRLSVELQSRIAALANDLGAEVDGLWAALKDCPDAWVESGPGADTGAWICRLEALVVALEKAGDRP